MENNHRTALYNRQNKDRQLILKFIIKQVEKGTQLSISELKEKYSEDQVFNIALKHVTTTKKALCTALKIPVEAGCRYKRSLEKEGYLVQSKDEVFCPYTKHKAHLISTNSKEFEKLLNSSSNQTKLF